MEKITQGDGGHELRLKEGEIKLLRGYWNKATQRREGRVKLLRG